MWHSWITYQPSHRDRLPIGATHEQSSQHHFVEPGIGTSGQEAVQLQWEEKMSRNITTFRTGTDCFKPYKLFNKVLPFASLEDLLCQLWSLLTGRLYNCCQSQRLNLQSPWPHPPLSGRLHKIVHNRARIVELAKIVNQLIFKTICIKSLNAK